MCLRIHLVFFHTLYLFDIFIIIYLNTFHIHKKRSMLPQNFSHALQLMIDFNQQSINDRLQPGISISTEIHLPLADLRRTKNHLQ